MNMDLQATNKEALLALGITAISTGVTLIEYNIIHAILAVALGFSILFLRGYMKYR